MPGLKGVILGVEDVIAPNGTVDKNILSEVQKLIDFFKKRGIVFAILTTRKWTLDNDEKTLLEEELKKSWGDFPYYCTATDSQVPPKQQAASTEYVRAQLGLKKEETIYIGASDTDMRAAVNGGLLFLRATWWAQKTSYGFEFSTPKDIARFIDTFCLRKHFWCHEIHDGNFHFYALAPFSTYKPEYTLYSEDARNAAKHGMGSPDFWVGAIISSLYFSGVCHKIDHICVYPGHQKGSGNTVMNDAMDILGKCFRASYIPDLIERHTTATKSQHARNAGKSLDHLNQLNSISLNSKPLKNVAKGTKYVRSPLNRNKTVLIVDDICTRGYSLESARAFIEQTGAKVILTAWLKTINTNIAQLSKLGKFDPYTPQTFTQAPVAQEFLYSDHIVDNLAPTELTTQFKNYNNWNWP